MAFKLRALLLVLLVLTVFKLNSSSLVYLGSGDSTTEVIVVYRDEKDLNLLIGFGCFIERVYRYFNTVLAVCPQNTLKEIKSYGLSIAPNANLSIDTTVESFRVINMDTSSRKTKENVTSYWSWAISKVSADIMWWHLGEEGSNAVIAILDTGIDPFHPLLAGKLAGWIEFDAKGRPLCTIPRDTHGHGTWVASIAVGGDGLEHIFGVAPKAKLLVALVLPYGSGSVAQVLAGLEWSLDPYDYCANKKLNLRPNVVSMSFGALGNYSNVFLPAIAKLIENGIVPVAAIGNGGPYTSSNPGNIWGVIGVGATDLDDDIAPFSSYEEVEWPSPPEIWPFKGYYPKMYRKPDVVAPGVDVPGAFPGGMIVIGSGTSAATPIVAGMAAIVSAKLMAYGFSGPSLVEKVYEIVTTTTMAIDHWGAGKGMVDFYRALAKSIGLDVKTVHVVAIPPIARPLDNITLRIIDPISEIPTTNVSVYMSGVRVYSGAELPKQIQVQIPLTHMGRNHVVIVGGPIPALYGKTSIMINPVLIADAVCEGGGYCNVTVSGLGIGDLLGAYLGYNMITLDFASLRGTYIASILTPLAREDTYNLTIIDFANPQITLRAVIKIIPPRVKSQMVPVSVSTKQYYIMGTKDFIDLFIYNGTVEQVSITSVFPLPIDVKVLNITVVQGNVYRIWIDIGMGVEQEVYAVMNASIALNGVRTPYLFVIRIVPSDPYKLQLDEIKKLSDIYEKVRGAIAEIARIKDELNKTGVEIENVKHRVSGISENVRVLEAYGKEHGEKLDSLWSAIETLRIQMAVALSLATVATTVAILVAVRARKAIGVKQ